MKKKLVGMSWTIGASLIAALALAAPCDYTVAAFNPCNSCQAQSPPPGCSVTGYSDTLYRCATNSSNGKCCQCNYVRGNCSSGASFVSSATKVDGPSDDGLDDHVCLSNKCQPI